MRLTRKLPLVIVGLAVAASLVTGFLALTKFERELARSEQSQLVALLEARNAELNRFFTRLRADLGLYATNPAVRESMAEFSSAHATLALMADADSYLTASFTEGGRWKHGDAEAQEEADFYADYYMQVHDEFHPWINQGLRSRGLADVIFIDPRGTVVYTVKKNSDFTADLQYGPLAESGLADIYRRIKAAPRPGTAYFTDLEVNAPASGRPVLFLGAPVFSRTGTWIGIAVVQIPVSFINTILAFKKGMGETGETYVVGGDGLMRSQSRFLQRSTALKTRVDNESVTRALAGDTGVHLTLDYRGTPVYSAYAPVGVEDFRWVLLSEIDEAEVLARVKSARADMLWILLSIAPLLLLIGTMLARRIARPVVHVTEAMTALAEGDLDVRVTARRRGDEIGMLVRSFETLRGHEKERLRLAAEIAAKERLLSIAFENMSDGIFMVDEQLRFQMFNERYVDMVEVPADLVKVGGPMGAVLKFNAEQGLYGDGDVEELVRHRLETYDGQDFVEFELRTAGGRTNAFRKTALPDGGAVVVISDVTERKENEQRLRESERKLIQILGSSPVGAGISRLSDGQVMLVNQRQCELLGLPKEELLTRNRADFFDDPEGAEAMRRGVEEEGAVHGLEIDMRRGDGSDFPALVSVLPMNYEGDACRLVWVFDLSDIKAAQEEVLRGRERRIAILETSPIGVSIARRDDGGLLYANARQAELLGLDLETYLSGPMGAFWADPEARLAVNAALERDGAISDVEVHMKPADGSDFWALVSGSYFDHGGEPARMGWFCARRPSGASTRPTR